MHADAPLLIDVDLNILGQNEERFWRYETQIRQEYDWVPESLFAVKRAEILERFLNRSRVRPGMALAGGVLVRAFESVGWKWGGRWSGSPDYQHFSTNGR